MATPCHTPRHFGMSFSSRCVFHGVSQTPHEIIAIFLSPRHWPSGRRPQRHLPRLPLAPQRHAGTGAWKRVAKESLSLRPTMSYPSTPCELPPLKRPHGRFKGGRPQGEWPAAVFYPLGYPTPYACGRRNASRKTAAPRSRRSIPRSGGRC
jgi:hypothetical protein